MKGRSSISHRRNLKMNPSLSSLASSSCSTKRKRDSNSFDEPNCKRLRNDVFMNYSFEDIGNSFVSHLQESLRFNGFTICDHTKLPIGEDVCSKLCKAIEESEIYVLVFSIKYACCIESLDELVYIMDYFSNLDRRKVLPVFLNVGPSDVRSQQGLFKEAFEAHETKFDHERVRRWKQALEYFGGLSGYHLKNGDEAEFISKIVKELGKMQSPQKLYVTDHPVGIKSRVEELISMLRLDCKNVSIVAVLGISGIGKTTIVKATYNEIAAEFELSCFLTDIHYHCEKRNWKVKLQKKLISHLTQNDKLPMMSNHNEGVTKIRKLICGRKVLLVLDDVGNFDQLKVLGIHPQCFQDGSRIIVTTRDKQSLGNLSYDLHKIRLLNRRESFKLFTRLLFEENDLVDEKFVEEVVRYAGGLLLVIEVWSSHFKHLERKQWPNGLEKLKRIPHDDVQKKLQMSYDPLPDRAKKLFLDIVCFFDGVYKDDVVKSLHDEDSAFYPDIEIQYLVDKCLVNIDDGIFTMNDAIREMGQEIVRRENEDEPRRRSRLWDRRDVLRILTECLGTETIQSIQLDDEKTEEVINVQVEAFRKMSNLRLIKLGNNNISWICFDDDMPSLTFKKLRYLEWYGFPYKCIDMVDMANVVFIKLYHSKLETLWKEVKNVKKLRILEVSFSSMLTKTGDFYGLENLEKLELEECKNLDELDISIGCLHKLEGINLRGCSKLGIVDPECVMKVTGLRNLKHLHMGGCNLSHIPNEIGNLVLLEQINLSGNTFSSLPDSLSNLSQLVELYINNCSKLRLLPLLPSNLTRIDASGCWSLNMMPFDSKKRVYIFRTKVCKESPFTRRLQVLLTVGVHEVRNQNMIDSVFSFVAPMHLDRKICGIILYAISSHDWFMITPTMLNKTKDTSVVLRELPFDGGSMGVMFYPLGDTTLVVEAGDVLQLQFQPNDLSKCVLSCKLSLIYEGDVLDSELRIQDVIEATLSIQTNIAFESNDNVCSISSEDDECEYW